MLQTNRVIQWMNVIRQCEGKTQYRILESFWESQLTSKQWIVDTLKQKNILTNGHVYIFGGWFGVLGGMLLDEFTGIRKVYSVDIDPAVKKLGEQLNPDVIFATSDMQEFTLDEQPALIINTSTEHITQSVYETWLQRIPKRVPIILQGNNYFSCEEHVRCSQGLNEFKKMNPLDSIIYEGQLDCKQFMRYMTIGYRL